MNAICLIWLQLISCNQWTWTVTYWILWRFCLEAVSHLLCCYASAHTSTWPLFSSGFSHGILFCRVLLTTTTKQNTASDVLTGWGCSGVQPFSEKKHTHSPPPPPPPKPKQTTGTVSPRCWGNKCTCDLCHVHNFIFYKLCRRGERQTGIKL